MSHHLPALAGVDARFMLPRPIRRAVVLGDLPRWREGLDELAVDWGPEPPPGGPIDLVVAPSGLAAEAAGIGGDAVILEGRRGKRALERSGYRVARFLPLPSNRRTDVFLPLEEPIAAAYALSNWVVAPSGWRGLRNRAAGAAIRRRLFPPVRDLAIVGLRAGGRPFVLQAAEHLGVPQQGPWFLSPSGLDKRWSRNIFQVFRPRSPVPEWVVKVSRGSGSNAVFQSEEDGFRAVAEAGPSVAEHAPRFLGRFEVGGLSASVETAVVGRRLDVILNSSRSREARLRILEPVVSWLVEVAHATRAAPGRLDPYREELARAIASIVEPRGLSGDLPSRIPPVPATFEHGDFTTANVILSEEGSIQVVDLPRARRFGFPLFDVLNLAEATLTWIDPDGYRVDRVERFRRLFRGDLELSRVMFEWVRRVARASGVPLDAVGDVATLCWARHAARRVRDGAPGEPGHVRFQMLDAWAADPALGAGWSAWRSAR